MEEHEKSLRAVKGEVLKLSTNLDRLRSQIGYLLFDIEATRRERDYWRKLAEERQDS